MTFIKYKTSYGFNVLNTDDISYIQYPTDKESKYVELYLKSTTDYHETTREKILVISKKQANALISIINAKDLDSL